MNTNRHRLNFDLKRHRLILSGLALLFALLTGIAVFPLFLNGFMIYETPLRPVQAVFVHVGLGNVLDSAVDLYHEGMVETVIVTYDRPRTLMQADKPVLLHHLTLQQLIEKGVPETALASLQLDEESKIESRIQLRNWMRQHHIRSYLMFTNTYHSRYAQMMHEDTFPEGSVDLVLLSSDSRRVWRKQWLNIQNTLLRMIWWEWVEAPRLQDRLAAESG